MAIQQYPQSQSSSLLLDLLYCNEETEHLVDDDDDDDDEKRVERETDFLDRDNALKFSSLVLLDQDLVWDDDELVSLFSKEQEQFFYDQCFEPCVLIARKEAIDWILKVKTHFGFSALTVILAINYLDRFLFSFHFQKDKPWMIHLASVTCLSLAAKVEETHVPLLLDLQMETKYLFEAKNIKRMELLVMSTLEWRLNPVTPIAFLDHIIRRLGFKTQLHWEFYKKCEALILSLVSESRFVHYLPSALATATMLYVIDRVEPSNPIDYQNQLLNVLKTTREEVKECYDLITEVTSAAKEKDGCSSCMNMQINELKRKYDEIDASSCLICTKRRPNDIVDADFSKSSYSTSSEYLNDFSAFCSTKASSSSSSSPHYDYDQHNNNELIKKMRQVVSQEQSNNSREFVVDALESLIDHY